MRGCARPPRSAADYQAKISGPLFDRIDLHVDVPAVKPADLALPAPSEGTAAVAARVAAARDVQAARYAAAGKESGAAEGTAEGAGTPFVTGVRVNAHADGALLDAVAEPDDAGRALLTDAAERLHLSARGWHRTLRVARTIADLDGADTVRRVHVAEALGYRRVAPGR